MPFGNLNVDTVTTSTAGGILGAGNASIMKNRIQNGAMVIDQRNAGASTTPSATATNVYTLDRWAYFQSVASKFAIQQNAGSVTPPAGFSNYLGLTSQSAYSVGSSDYFGVMQIIEGFNVYDLGWGTANAKTVTLSFQVYSSLTGTFGGAIQNAAQNRSYPFTYTISSANTWTSISVTVAGDTGGTWVGASNSGSIRVNFGLGMGSSFSGTAGAWAGANTMNATGATSVVGTNGATFYITGVQLEVGSSATGFEYRQYGQELALCQRYYWKKLGLYSAANTTVGAGMMYSNTDARCTLFNPVVMRSAPTISFSGSGFGFERAGTFLGTIGTPASANTSLEASLLYSGSGTSTGTSGQGTIWNITDNTSYISVSSEL